MKKHLTDVIPAKAQAMEEGRFSRATAPGKGFFAFGKTALAFLPALPGERSPYGMPLRVGIQGLLLLVLAACGVGGDDGGDPAARLAEQADAFLGDMHAGAWNAAYSRLYPGLRSECGSAEGLKSAVEAAGARPVSWTLREPRARKHSGQITGTVEKAGGQGIVELSLDLIDGEWRITAWSADNRELCQAARG